jgi:hypothetical protein
MNLIKKKGTIVAYIVEGFTPAAEEVVAAEEVRALRGRDRRQYEEWLKE